MARLQTLMKALYLARSRGNRRKLHLVEDILKVPVAEVKYTCVELKKFHFILYKCTARKGRKADLIDKLQAVRLNVVYFARMYYRI